jgi:hypothetical protein
LEQFVEAGLLSCDHHDMLTDHEDTFCHSAERAAAAASLLETSEHTKQITKWGSQRNFRRLKTFPFSVLDWDRHTTTTAALLEAAIRKIN